MRSHRREKLILVTTFRNLEKQTDKWHRQASGASERLSDYTVLQARSYADWIFPALMRHPQAEWLCRMGRQSGRLNDVAGSLEVALTTRTCGVAHASNGGSETRTAE